MADETLWLHNANVALCTDTAPSTEYAFMQTLINQTNSTAPTAGNMVALCAIMDNAAKRALLQYARTHGRPQPPGIAELGFSS